MTSTDLKAPSSSSSSPSLNPNSFTHTPQHTHIRIMLPSAPQSLTESLLFTFQTPHCHKCPCLSQYNSSILMQLKYKYSKQIIQNMNYSKMQTFKVIYISDMTISWTGITFWNPFAKPTHTHEMGSKCGMQTNLLLRKKPSGNQVMPCARLR